MAPGAKSRVPMGLGVRTRRPVIAMKSPVSLGQVMSPPWASVPLSVKSGAWTRQDKPYQRVLTDILVCSVLLTFQREQVWAPKGKRPGGAHCNGAPMPRWCCWGSVCHEADLPPEEAGDWLQAASELPRLRALNAP